jgi:tetratricopeptide (TPR) repeat protein
MGKYHCLAGVISFICLSFSSFGQNGYDRNQLSLFYQNQEFEKAINYLQANSPVQDNSQYHVDLGYAFFMHDELDLSKKEFETVYQRQPENKQANLYLAQLFSLMKMPDSDLFYYRNLTRLQPENYRFWQKSAQLFNDLNKFDSALVYIDKAYSLNRLSGRLTVSRSLA